MQKLNFNKNRSLKALSEMPQMDMTLEGWEIPLEIEVIIQDVIEGDLAETATTVNFKGVWQPLKMQNLELKPEGQRAWEWIWLHAKKSELDLETADKVKFNKKLFKVMSVKDSSLNGFMEYELCRDYEGLQK